MTKWNSLVGKFSPEEMEVISAFQKKTGLNKNQIVKVSIYTYISLVENWQKIIESAESKIIDSKYRLLKKILSKSPDLKIVQPAAEEITKLFDKSVNQVFKEHLPVMRKFTKKRKVGRPKSASNKRGRPKDTGI